MRMNNKESIKRAMKPIRITNIFLIIILLSGVITSLGCSRSRMLKKMTTDEKMDFANSYFERGKYGRAAEIYLDIVFERSSKHTPAAQFLLGESYFKHGRYTEAIFEYRELIRLFPEHSKVNIVYFRIGEAYMNLSLNPHYSQEETVAAIDAFDVFLDKFPFDERRDKAIEYLDEAKYKLLRKKYYNGEIYYKLFDYSSAIFYFDEIIQLDMRDDIDKMSRYYSALIYVERKDRDNAKGMMETLSRYYPDSRQASRISQLFSRTFN